MKSAGRSTPSASEVMGSVEVFEHSSASGATTPWTSWNTLCLSAVSSKTASMTASQPARSAVPAVGRMRASRASAFSCVVRPRWTAFAQSFSAWALPLCAASCDTSLRTTSIPALAQAYAMPAPIMPAPRTAALRTGRGATPSGRLRPALTAWRSKKNAWIMFFAV